MLSLHGLTKDSNGGGVEKIVKYAEESKAEAESYYGEGKRAPASWAGSGARALGLAADGYDRDAMMLLLAGHGPRGETLARIAPNHRPGWDLTFSAPKSVSVVWAIANAEHRAELEAAHDAALRAAIRHIEAEGMAVVRSGRGGVEKEPAGGLTFATYRHGTSRAKDPDLHSHCLLINLARTEGEEWRRLDPAAIYRRKIEIGAIYRAELAAQMQSLGYDSERDGKSFRLKNVSLDLCEKWSQRSAQIRASLGGIEAGGKAKASAALKSRAGKQPSGDREALHAAWRAEAAAAGVTQESIARANQEESESAERAAAVEKILADAIARIEDQKSVFTANELYREIAIGAQCVIDAEGARSIMHAAVASAGIVKLPEARDENGKRRPGCYTTREMLNLETKLAAGAMARRGEGRHVVDGARIAAAIRATEREKALQLSDEQRAAIAHVCGGRDGVAAVVGVAGAGKSTALDAARRAWESAGYRVRGAALQGRAAEALEESSGIRSDTLSMLMLRVTPDNRTGTIADPLTRKDIIVIDEAGLVGSRQMASLAEAATRAGAKVVLVGHHKQYQAIAAGGAFAALARRLGAARLEENRRQTDQDHRTAVSDILRGDIAGALAWYRERGLLTIAEGDGVAEVAAAWQEDRAAGREPLVLSARHDAVRAINESARAAVAESRGVGVDVLITDREKKPAGHRNFAIGDTIVFKRNDRGLKVKNGARATIEAIKATADGGAMITARLGGSGRKISWDTRAYGTIDHGWAVTGHASQGLTEQRAILHIADPQMLDLHAFYVGASRAREQTRIVISSFALDDAAAAEGVDEDNASAQLTGLINALGRVREKEFSADYFEDVSGFANLDSADDEAVAEAGQ